MGNKINPLLLRSNNKLWFSRWFYGKNISKYVTEDLNIRKVINNTLNCHKTEKIIIERLEKLIIVKIYTNNQNIIKKKKKKLNLLINKFLHIKDKKILFFILKNKNNFSISNIMENIIEKIKKRENYKLYIKNVVNSFKKKKGFGIKILISGRIGGVEIARKEKFQGGCVGKLSISNNVNYLFSHFKTKYGILGIKIFINKNNEKKFYKEKKRKK